MTAAVQPLHLKLVQKMVGVQNRGQTVAHWCRNKKGLPSMPQKSFDTGGETNLVCFHKVGIVPSTT